MTQDNDFIRLHLKIGARNFPVKRLGLEWPPPERIIFDGTRIREARPSDDPELIFAQVNRSRLDDETAAHPNIARGAEYRYLTETP